MARSAGKSAETGTAAYLPFSTFLSVIEALGDCMPLRIDHTLWPARSYQAASQIIIAFRFLGLVDASDAPSANLRELVSNPGARKETLRRLLRESYPAINPEELARMTPQMLDERMEKHYNVSGETRTKAVRFLLHAAEYSGVPLGQRLQERNSGRAATEHKRRQRIPEPLPSPLIEVAQSPSVEPRWESTRRLPHGTRVEIRLYSDDPLSPEDSKLVRDISNLLLSQ